MAQSAAALATHIRNLLPQLRPLLKAPVAVPERRSLDADALTTLIPKLRDGVGRARDEGAFLNVWAVAGLRRNEVRNCAVLAWFLNPRGSHGAGATYLKAVMALLPEVEAGGLEQARLKTELRPQGSDRDRVDIVVELPERVIFIEAKIDAPEGLNQLARYRNAAARLHKAVSIIYLTRTAPVDEHDGVHHLTWRQVARALTKASGPRQGQSLANQFSQHIGAFV